MLQFCAVPVCGGLRRWARRARAAGVSRRPAYGGAAAPAFGRFPAAAVAQQALGYRPCISQFSATRQHRSARHIMRLALCFVVLASVLTACGGGKGGAAAPVSASVATAASAAAAAASAPALLLSAEDLHTLGTSVLANGPVITGSLIPEKRADLRSEISAVVQQVFKENGQSVKRGELLVRLDDTALRESLASADEAVRASGQAFEQAERQVARLKTLQAQGMTSTQALEDAEVRRNNAQSDLVATRSRASAARQQLQRTEVRAPFDGVLSERKVSAGDTAQIGKELLKVMDPRSLRFEGLVSADRRQDIKIGQTVNFRVNGAEQSEFAGRVTRVDAAANATTRQVEVFVAFADPARSPGVAGLFAEGRIETSGAAVLMVPEAAVQRSAELAYVWRVQAGKLNKVAVTLGERDARRGDYPVRSGLAVGDVVLRKPGSALVDGQSAQRAAAAAPRAASAVSAAN
jgi:membrane fusion protein, multidrug efflux system